VRRRGSVCSTDLLLVCLELKSDSFSYRTQLHSIPKLQHYRREDRGKPRFPAKMSPPIGTGINLVIRGASMAGGRNLVFRLLLSWLSAIATRRLQPVRLFCIEWRLKDHFHRNTQLKYSLILSVAYRDTLYSFSCRSTSDLMPIGPSIKK
jgi:hypothetical protein